MKETKINIKDKQEISAEVKQESSTLSISLRPKKGQKLWEYCIATGEMEEVEIETTSIKFENAEKEDYSSVRKATRKEGYLYEVAINKPNALRKIVNRIISGKNS